MEISDYVDVFEASACKQVYDMKGGVAAVVDAVISHIHDSVLDCCTDLDEGRQEIVNYSVSIKKGRSNTRP